MELRLGTRGSRLALAQSEWVKRELEKRNPEIRITLCLEETSGDRDRTSPLNQLPTLGAFTKELDQALLERRCDLAVHSLKDLPTQPVDGLTIAAIPVREDPADVICTQKGHPVKELPPGAIIGTSSPRRQALVRCLRGDFNVREIRGNIDTRLRKLLDLHAYDALILAAAGLNRLGLNQHIAERLDPKQYPCAPGQGALAVVLRSADAETCRLVKMLDHPETRVASLAERTVLASLGGGCRLPLGAFAEITGELLVVYAVLYGETSENTVHVVETGSVSDPVGTGKRAADKILLQCDDVRLNEIQKGF